jgi:hypothetical protein
LDPATVALIARMSVAPNADWERHYDWLVRRLKVGGIHGTDNWADPGALYNFIAHDAQAARLDWKGAGSATLVGAPIFTTGVGYRGLSNVNTTDYLQFAAPNATAGIAQNSAHAMATHSVGTGSSALRRISGGSPVLVDNATLRINESGGLTRNLTTNTTSTDGRQTILINRSGPTATQYYLNGAQMKAGTAVSVVVDSSPLVTCYSTTLPMETISLGSSKTAQQVVDMAYAFDGFRRRVQAPAAP